MERHIRVRVPGLVFLLTLGFHLFSTKQGASFLQTLLQPKQEPPIVELLVAAGFAIFASESFGYVLNSVFVFVFNLRGGYSGQYNRNLAYANFPDLIRDEYSPPEWTSSEQVMHQEFEARWPGFTPEQLLVYFLWHRRNERNTLEPWVERRNTAYFSALSTVYGIAIATGIAAIWMCAARYNPSGTNAVVLLATAILSTILVINGIRAMRDGLSIIDLHIANHFNPGIQRLYGDHANKSGGED